MSEACLDAGLAAPLLEERGTGFRVTIFSERTQEPRMDPADSAIIETLMRAGSDGLATSDVAREVGRSARSTRTRLVRLAERGLVVRIGSSRNDPKARWLPANPAQ